MKIRILASSIHTPHALLNFTGWTDAGNVVESTLLELMELFPCREVAVWDMDGYWHTGVNRPQVRIQHGQIKELQWPEYRFHVCTPPSGDPILIGNGPEPDCNWRSFVEELLGQLREWGCSDVFLLGSMLDQIFHDEVVISCAIQDPQGYNQAHELGCGRIEYEGPAAIHAAIMHAAPGKGMRCVSLWAHLPFYIKSRHELLMAGYIKMLGRMVMGEAPDTRRLEEAWRERLNEIESDIQQDQDLRHALELLRQQDRATQSMSQSGSKIVRMDDFLKKRQEHEHEGEDGPDPQPDEPDE